MTTLIPKVDLMNGGSTPTGAINRPINLKLQDTVHVKDFGAVGDGVADDTTAVQNAINYAIANHCTLDITNGYYLVSTILIENANGLNINGSGGSLIGKSTGGTYAAVLTIHNSVSIIIDNLGVSASFNLGYSSAVKVYQSGAEATSYNFFNNMTVSSAQIAWTFGDSTYPDVVLSETTVTGGYTYSCPIAVIAIGTQTVINFVGCMLTSSYGTNTDTSWLARPSYIIYTVGAYVGVTSGEMLMVSTTTYAGVLMQPIASPTYGNFYGSVYVQGVEFECASQYVVINNPAGLTPIASASAETAIRFIGCNGYHSGNFAPMVVVDADYTGSLVFSNNNFYAGSARTIGNIDAGSASNTTCNIYCDDQSFGYNFVQGLSAISGGIAHFTRRMILQVANCNGQTLPSGTATTLIWTAANNTQDTQRFTDNYSTSTGIFTVPAGGLKSVAINYVVRTTQPTAILNSAILLNGSPVDYIPTMMGGSGNGGWLRAEVEVGDLAAGTTIAIQAQQIGTASATNGGQYENMTIIARN